MTTHNHPKCPAAGSDITAPEGYRPEPARVEEALGKRSFAVLATTSPAGRPHAAGVLDELIGWSLAEQPAEQWLS